MRPHFLIFVFIWNVKVKLLRHEFFVVANQTHYQSVYGFIKSFDTPDAAPYF